MFLTSLSVYSSVVRNTCKKKSKNETHGIYVWNNISVYITPLFEKLLFNVCIYKVEFIKSYIQDVFLSEGILMYCNRTDSFDCY